MTALSLGSILISHNMSRVAIFIILCEYAVFLAEPKASRWCQLPPLHPVQALGIWKSFVIYSSRWKFPTHIIPCQLTKVCWCIKQILPSNINVPGRTDLSLFYSYSWILEFIIAPISHGSPREPRTSETMCLK